MTAQELQTTVSTFRTHLADRYPQLAVGFQPVDGTARADPAETALLSPNAVPKRRHEFAAGRAAARSALRQIGFGHVTIAKGVRGAPVWPDHVIGSITHTDQLAIAAVLYGQPNGGIGIDLEKTVRFHPDLAKAILTPAEQSVIAHENHALGPYFSAKESTYKAISLHLDTVIGFQDVALHFSPDQSHFTAHAVTHFCNLFPVGKPFLQGHVFQCGGMILSIASMG